MFAFKDYFRYRNMELVTDAYFWHLVPVAFLSLLGVFVTAWTNVKSTKGISNIKDLSKDKLSNEVIQELQKREMVEDERDPRGSKSSYSEYGHYGYGKTGRKRRSLSYQDCNFLKTTWGQKIRGIIVSGILCALNNGQEESSYLFKCNKWL